jgi:predicted enzyme related to lactoylglutathione lyase
MRIPCSKATARAEPDVQGDPVAAVSPGFSPQRWIPGSVRIYTDMNFNPPGRRPVVHLELHTGDQALASAFYAGLLHWRPELIRAGSGSYLAIELGCRLGGGIVECGIRQPLWVPYVEVDRVEEVTDHARRLGAAVLLEPREGPSGWRSVISSPAGGHVAFWQPKP